MAVLMSKYFRPQEFQQSILIKTLILRWEILPQNVSSLQK